LRQPSVANERRCSAADGRSLPGVERSGSGQAVGDRHAEGGEQGGQLLVEQPAGGGDVGIAEAAEVVARLVNGEVGHSVDLLVAGPELVEGGVDVDDEPVDGSGNGGPGHGSSSLTSRVRSMSWASVSSFCCRSPASFACRVVIPAFRYSRSRSLTIAGVPSRLVLRPISRGTRAAASSRRPASHRACTAATSSPKPWRAKAAL